MLLTGAARPQQKQPWGWWRVCELRSDRRTIATYSPWCRTSWAPGEQLHQLLYSSSERSSCVPSRPSGVIVSRPRCASGPEQRRTPRPSGFRDFLSQPSGVMINCGRHASGQEQRRTPRPSGFWAFLAQPSGVMVSCGRHASGPERRRTPRPSGFRVSLAQPSGVMEIGRAHV